MKVLLAVCGLLCAVPAWAGEDCNAKGTIFSVCADQGKMLDTALAQAKTERKPLLVIFGANWCPWCQSLHKILQESDLPEADAYTIADLALYNGQEKVASGEAALRRVLKMARVKKPGEIPMVFVVNPAKAKARQVALASLVKHSKVSKGYDPGRVFAALKKAAAKVE